MIYVRLVHDTQFSCNNSTVVVRAGTLLEVAAQPDDYYFRVDRFGTIYTIPRSLVDVVSPLELLAETA